MWRREQSWMPRRSIVDLQLSWWRYGAAVAETLWWREAKEQGLILRLADQVATRRAELEGESDARLLERYVGFRSIARLGRLDDAACIDATAVAGEVIHRETGMTPYPVQFAAALGLVRGRLIEMGTGEGKTLAGGIAALMLAAPARGCHVATVNDYLADRDGQWLAAAAERLGLAVRVVVGATSGQARLDGYAADITYTTNKELVADHLRFGLQGVWSRDHGRGSDDLLVSAGDRGGGVRRHALIIDEADSVLIDEAATPVIIARPVPRKASHSRQAIVSAVSVFADRMKEDDTYVVDRETREVLVEDGVREQLSRELCRAVGRAVSDRLYEEALAQALIARTVMEEGVDYIVQDGKVKIVDPFTGRAMPDRSWRHGLQQAVEAKEGLEPTPETEVVARCSYQSFFAGYRHLCGMSGTLREVANEVLAVYRLRVVRIPPHRPSRLRVTAPEAFTSEAARLSAVVESTESVIDRGRAVLIGTTSITQSECVSLALEQAGIEHELLSARQDAEEAALVGRAGGARRVTVATNMAGRGTDIELETSVAERGGLHVIAYESQTTQRLDRQLLGRAGRQGQLGSGQILTCPRVDEVYRPVLSWTESLKMALLVQVVVGRFRRLTLSMVRLIWSSRDRKRRSIAQRNDEWVRKNVVTGSSPE